MVPKRSWVHEVANRRRAGPMRNRQSKRAKENKHPDFLEELDECKDEIHPTVEIETKEN